MFTKQAENHLIEYNSHKFWYISGTFPIFQHHHLHFCYHFHVIKIFFLIYHLEEILFEINVKKWKKKKKMKKSYILLFQTLLSFTFFIRAKKRKKVVRQIETNVQTEYWPWIYKIKSDWITAWQHPFPSSSARCTFSLNL